MLQNKYNMKHYQRVSLKSPIYRQCRSKSPINHIKQTVGDTNKLFQKVCCPNCRYLFKVLNKENPLTQTNHAKQTKTVQTNTQTYIKYDDIAHVKNKPIYPQSPKNQKVQNISIYDLENTQRTTINSYLNYGDLKPIRLFQRQQTINDFNSNIPILSSKQNTSRSNISVKYQKQQKICLKSSFKNNITSQFQIEKSQQQIKKTHKKDQQEKGNSVIMSQAVEKILQQKQIKQMKQFILDLPSQVQIPGYLKMLLQQASIT